MFKILVILLIIGNNLFSQNAQSISSNINYLLTQFKTCYTESINLEIKQLYNKYVIGYLSRSIVDVEISDIVKIGILNAIIIKIGNNTSDISRNIDNIITIKESSINISNDIIYKQINELDEYLVGSEYYNDIQSVYSYILNADKEYTKSINMAERLLKNNSNDITAMNIIANSYMLMKNYSNAIFYYSILTNIVTNRSAIYYSLAKGYLESGMSNEGILVFSHYVKLETNYFASAEYAMILYEYNYSKLAKDIMENRTFKVSIYSNDIINKMFNIKNDIVEYNNEIIDQYNWEINNKYKLYIYCDLNEYEMLAPLIEYLNKKQFYNNRLYEAFAAIYYYRIGDKNRAHKIIDQIKDKMKNYNDINFIKNNWKYTRMLLNTYMELIK